jgi:hypothetical protein
MTSGVVFENGGRVAVQGVGFAFVNARGEKVAMVDAGGNFHIKGKFINSSIRAQLRLDEASLDIAASTNEANYLQIGVFAALLSLPFLELGYTWKPTLQPARLPVLRWSEHDPVQSLRSC